MILVPQIIRQAEKKKPKHHHHKVLPVVHSGKVIHAHHHHGKVDHVHKHDAKAKHEHKHTGTAAHKHSHFGVGSHTHKHLGKASHDHKHTGKAAHKHHHVGKGSIHHHHSKHHHHHPHPEAPAPAPPAKPPKKFTGPFYFGTEPYQNAYQNVGPRVKIDQEILRALNPALVPFTGQAVASGPAIASGAPGRIIQIRFQDENDPNAVKEIDIDTGSDVAVLKKNYLTPGEVEGITFTANQDDGEAGDEEDADVSEESYQLGDGYKLAASAAARAQAVAQDENVVMFAEQDVAEPSNMVQDLSKNVAYSDTFHYQY